MYPDGRTNPVPAHFAGNTSVEMHPPVSPRLLQQRYLDREGRAICRIVFAHGIGVQFIANVFCVSEDAVIQAIENKPSHGENDKAEHDYWYVSNEYRNQYPSLAKRTAANGDQTTAGVDNSMAQKDQPSAPDSSKIGPTRKTGGGKGRGRCSNDVAVNNPTARHFKDNLPLVNLLGSNTKLDRKGRAICRIMHPYVQSYTKIARIFGINHPRVRNAVLNAYGSPDNTTEDYDYAGKDFKDEYPPLSDKPPKKTLDVRDTRKRGRSPELDTVSSKRSKKDQTAAITSANPQKTVVIEIPFRAKGDRNAAGVKAFLKNIGGFDLSHWQGTFKAKGLTSMEELTTLARLEESRLVKTLTRLFANQKMAEVHILLLADALMDLVKEAA
ncbi:hypothetical protein C8F04DRAFT_1399976 [Mycena alexandri]|uniref:Uncharacterized protein n=1 Tax=Mycena alexandri TaxID=1745969 RepID=A0AAD6SJD3_9AGAR|nr:hypothetical protein C8F04DRAFT_1399976 [Mycena alexandri]